MLLISEENEDSIYRKELLNTVKIQLLFSFSEVHKRNSDQLFYSFFEDRREGRPKVIKYFTESGPRNLQLTIFTPCLFQLNN